MPVLFFLSKILDSIHYDTHCHCHCHCHCHYELSGVTMVSGMMTMMSSMIIQCNCKEWHHNNKQGVQGQLQLLN